MEQTNTAIPPSYRDTVFDLDSFLSRLNQIQPNMTQVQNHSKLVILLFYYLRTLNLLFHRSLWLQSTRIGFPGYEVGL